MQIASLRQKIKLIVTSNKFLRNYITYVIREYVWRANYLLTLSNIQEVCVCVFPKAWFVWIRNDDDCGWKSQLRHFSQSGWSQLIFGLVCKSLSKSEKSHKKVYQFKCKYTVISSLEQIIHLNSSRYLVTSFFENQYRYS